MNEKFSQHPGQILREDRLGLFTPSPFLPVHFHWTTTIMLLPQRDRETPNQPSTGLAHC